MWWKYSALVWDIEFCFDGRPFAGILGEVIIKKVFSKVAPQMKFYSVKVGYVEKMWFGRHTKSSPKYAINWRKYSITEVDTRLAKYQTTRDTPVDERIWAKMGWKSTQNVHFYGLFGPHFEPHPRGNCDNIGVSRACLYDVYIISTKSGQSTHNLHTIYTHTIYTHTKNTSSSFTSTGDHLRTLWGK